MPDDIRDRLERALAFESNDATRDAISTMNRKAERAALRKPSVLHRFSGRTLTAVGVVAFLSAGAATATVATPVVWDWITFVPDASTTLVLDSGVSCEVAYIARPDYANGQRPEDAVARAQEYLRTLNLDALPVEQRIAERVAGRNPVVPRIEGDSSRVSSALSDLVFEGMYADLEEHGYSAGVSLEGGVTCDEGPGD